MYEFGIPANNFDDVITATVVGDRLANTSSSTMDFDGAITGGIGE